MNARSLARNFCKNYHATFHEILPNSDIDSLRDFYVMLHLEVNDYGTKKDMLIKLFIGKQLKYDFNFKDLCAF